MADAKWYRVDHGNSKWVKIDQARQIERDKKMAKKTQDGKRFLSVWLDKELDMRLEKEAARVRNGKSWVAREALYKYLGDAEKAAEKAAVEAAAALTAANIESAESAKDVENVND